MIINYNINTATSDDIDIHLTACNDNFIPALSEKVDIADYALKLSKHAVNFEAWDGGVLAGLIAAYFNDTENGLGYITNVSTVGGYSGRGIASNLLERCIAYGREQQFESIALEVNKQSLAAVNLYQKFGFVTTGESDNMLKMNLSPLNP